MVFISGGISHTSFGGIGIGYYFGFNPILGAAVFALLSAFGLEYITKRTDLRSDSLIGILWSLGMAVGIIFIFLTPGYAPNLMTYLFGSILTVSAKDLRFMGIIALVVLTVFIVFYRLILYVAFDKNYALTHDISVSRINYLVLMLVALTIVINIKVVGIILVISMLTIPQSIANIYFKRFDKIMLFSVVFGLIGSVSGLILSYYLNIPSGATIIFTLVIIFAILKSIKKIYHKNLYRKN